MIRTCKLCGMSPISKPAIIGRLYWCSNPDCRFHLLKNDEHVWNLANEDTKELKEKIKELEARLKELGIYR